MVTIILEDSGIGGRRRRVEEGDDLKINKNDKEKYANSYKKQTCVSSQ
jgi:hypothetical protein